MNAYITSQEELWEAAANLGESWERIVYLKNVIHPLLFNPMQLPLSDQQHPGNQYGLANDLEGNISRMYEKTKDIVSNDGNYNEYSNFLQKLFTHDDSDSDDDMEGSMLYFMAVFITKYMEYVATLHNEGQADVNNSDSDSFSSGNSSD